MATNLIESYFVDTVVFNVKFAPSIKVASITNERFILLTNEATPQVVSTDPFEDIRIDYDYDSIGKSLGLKWKAESLSASSAYTLKLSGFRNTSGEIIADASVNFHTTASESSATPSYSLTEPEPVSIIDFSLIPDAFILTGDDIVDPTADEQFAVVETDPINFDAFLPPDYKDGIVTIKFNAAPDPSKLNSGYFFVERRPIQRRPSRWETVTPTSITDDNALPWVYIQMPIDVNGDYYITNYKYRVRISKDLGV